MNRKLWSVVAVVFCGCYPRFQLGAEYAKRPAHLHGIRHFLWKRTALLELRKKIWNFFLCNGSDAYNQNCRIKKRIL